VMWISPNLSLSISLLVQHSGPAPPPRSALLADLPLLKEGVKSVQAPPSTLDIRRSKFDIRAQPRIQLPFFPLIHFPCFFVFDPPLAFLGVLGGQRFPLLSIFLVSFVFLVVNCF